MWFLPGAKQSLWCPNCWVLERFEAAVMAQEHFSCSDVFKLFLSQKAEPHTFLRTESWNRRTQFYDKKSNPQPLRAQLCFCVLKNLPSVALVHCVLCEIWTDLPGAWLQHPCDTAGIIGTLLCDTNIALQGGPSAFWLPKSWDSFLNLQGQPCATLQSLDSTSLAKGK